MNTSNACFRMLFGILCCTTSMGSELCIDLYQMTENDFQKKLAQSSSVSELNTQSNRLEQCNKDNVCSLVSDVSLCRERIMLYYAESIFYSMKAARLQKWITELKTNDSALHASLQSRAASSPTVRSVAVSDNPPINAHSERVPSADADPDPYENIKF